MFRHTLTTHLLGGLAAFVWLPMLASGLDPDLCSNFNTGETPKNISIFQTNGLCHDFCQDDYAFAITQSNACWCSNYAPAKSTREDLSDCNTPCPAYPDEPCGGAGRFGYVSLEIVLPSGTRGGSSSTSSTSDADEETSTEAATTSTEDTESSTTQDSKPTSQVKTVTAGGTIKTVTVAPTETNSGSGSSAGDNQGVTVSDKGLSTGEIVGIVIGTIVGAFIIIGIPLFFFLRRRKERKEQEQLPGNEVASPASGSSQPNMSAAGSNPTSPVTNTKRNSMLQIDPRMNPFNQGLYDRRDSHESINTLRDDHDYSRRIQPRVLRATNPDPE